MWDRHLAGLAQRMWGAARPAAAALSPPPQAFLEANLGLEAPKRRNSWDKTRAQPLGFVPFPGHPPVPALCRGVALSGGFSLAMTLGSTLPLKHRHHLAQGWVLTSPHSRCSIHVLHCLPGTSQAVNTLLGCMGGHPVQCLLTPFPFLEYF